MLAVQIFCGVQVDYFEPHSLRASRDGGAHAVAEDIRHGSASRVCGDGRSLLEKLKQVLRRVREYAESRNAKPQLLKHLNIQIIPLKSYEGCEAI